MTILGGEKMGYEVKWIKISVDIFDDEKIRIIESMPEGDALVVMWFKLIALAGKTNAGGMIYLTRDIPYTLDSLAVLMRKPPNLVKLAIETFNKFGMIEIVDSFIELVNWEKYQNQAALDELRKKTAERVKQYRLRKLQSKNDQYNVTCNVTETLHECYGNALDIDDIDKDKDKEKKEKKKKEKEKTPTALALKAPESKELYNKIKESFESIYGDFSDYAKEGAAIKRIIKLTKGDSNAIKQMIEAFWRLTKSPDKFWSKQPFLPSCLASGGIWDRVKLEAGRFSAAQDVSWLDKLEVGHDS